jgi:hypothetical protein
MKQFQNYVILERADRNGSESNPARSSKKTLDMLLAIIFVVGFINVSYAREQHAPPDPHGFNDYAVFMATGTVPFEPHPIPEISGCGGFIFCDGKYFHEVIMGRDATEIDQEAAKAKEYFLDRFGIDVDNPALAGRVDFSSFYLDPRANYRIYTMAGEKIPAHGWEIRDGGFVALVIDPEGVELGGEFTGSGLAIQPGGMLVYGNYNIQKTNSHGKPKGEIVYSYRSDMPMIVNDWGELVVNCQISIDGFTDGEHDGKAQGMGLPLVPDAHGFTLSWRNVLTLDR